MKIYKIWQDVNNDYDTYDSAVVCANNKKEAQHIKPSRYCISDWDGVEGIYGSWCNATDVKVEYLGEAKEGSKKGVIVASYNAG